jgi:hypothetical protein
VCGRESAERGASAGPLRGCFSFARRGQVLCDGGLGTLELERAVQVEDLAARASPWAYAAGGPGAAPAACDATLCDSWGCDL